MKFYITNRGYGRTYYEMEKRIAYLERSIERKEETIISTYDDYITEVSKNEKQQKDFIEYIEHYIEALSPPYSYNNQNECVIAKSILQKYKSIIGE